MKPKRAIRLYKINPIPQTMKKRLPKAYAHRPKMISQGLPVPSSSKLSNRAEEEIREEEQLCQKVRHALISYIQPADLPDYDARLLQLRDAVAQEKLMEDQASLLEEMDRVAALSRFTKNRLQQKPDIQSPYFAHLGLEMDHGEYRDILLGKTSFIANGIRIVDWRHAPVSRVFYRYRQGDAFVEEFAGRQVSGLVHKRRSVSIVDGELVRIATSDSVYLRTFEGWRDVTNQTTRLQGGAGKAARPDTTRSLSVNTGKKEKNKPLRLGADGEQVLHRADKRLPEMAALLDGEQFDLLTRQGETMLVVSGGAGCGKTTVGLHRLAYLAYYDENRFRASRMLVLVFSPALKRYTERVLPALGLHGISVRTLAEWAAEQCRKNFSGLPKRICENTPAVVVRFKTHVALLEMLRDAVGNTKLSDPVRLFDELFTDRNWIRSGIQKHAPGAFSHDELKQIHRWCTDRHFRRVDGPDPFLEDDAPCYDEEDPMILLKLHQLLGKRLMYAKKRKLSYDHLMVDEAQDFSPLELSVLLQTVPNGSVTLAGDVSQRITDNDFSDWSQMLAAIGQKQFEISHLNVSYRSTRQIMEVARFVLGPLSDNKPWQASRSGSPVELLGFSELGEAMTFLSESLFDLVQREPTASIAVLAPDELQADEAYQILRRTELELINRVRGEEFSFGPGIELTDVASTKGLEFDYVVMLQVDEKHYPATPAARRLLHVGCSRAIHQLWLLHWEKRSPLLPGWLDAKYAGLPSPD